MECITKSLMEYWNFILEEDSGYMEMLFAVRWGNRLDVSTVLLMISGRSDQPYWMLFISEQFRACKH